MSHQFYEAQQHLKPKAQHAPWISEVLTYTYVNSVIYSEKQRYLNKSKGEPEEGPESHHSAIGKSFHFIH